MENTDNLSNRGSTQSLTQETTLTSTPIKSDDAPILHIEVPEIDVEEDEILSQSSTGAEIPSILITSEADPIEPEDVKVPILGYDVMEARSKFTKIYKTKGSKSKQSMPTEHPERSSLVDIAGIKVPIVGYEIMEQRERTIVYKIEIERSGFDRWFVFRRYNDFYQLNDKLKKIFPNFRLSLPPRRWFRSNYDREFLEERTLGLQAFLNNITGHKDICNCKEVREFFCFDDPPGPHDSLEESRTLSHFKTSCISICTLYPTLVILLYPTLKHPVFLFVDSIHLKTFCTSIYRLYPILRHPALCENLEETIYVLRRELDEKTEEIDILHDEIQLYKSQVEILTKELKEKKRDSSFVAMSPISNQISLAECDQVTSGTESDQSCSSSEGKLGKEERRVHFPLSEQEEPETPTETPTKTFTEIPSEATTET
ncbi:hypothetical protein LOTGIDRAFT_159182 [Lottia gigantea]|uniref:Sorting nexin-16 n=1 Tax=Lottia gigantea TaxID=225164 RepID=V4AMK9_LOTGI|nr:hypothetical protein LOTGIDRAFT_159182 [Lottia gigantea]ESO98377.1 hypothetical protein LOTGIDRAFT_159182 [Lottia gigantea]